MLPTLPIPIITAFILAYLLLRATIERRTHGMLLLLIAACCVQSLIVGLNLHYGVKVLRWVQPVTAACLPPLAWLAFIAVTHRDVRTRWDVIHLAGPLMVLIAVVLAPVALDVFIPVIFLTYGVALFALLSAGEGSLPKSNLGAGQWPLFIWRMLAGALVLSAASDALIGLLALRGGSNWLSWIVSAGSSLTLLALGGLGLSEAIGASDVSGDSASTQPSPEELEADATLIQRLDLLMAERKPYIDPDLSLMRLARKLGVPAKVLSTAVNRNKKENVSRYVNRFRIEDACNRMRQGSNVTEAMFASGFSTKSNFNREFVRVKGKNPTAWLSDFDR
jgi:AraC-like DNA-binding protein